MVFIKQNQHIQKQRKNIQEKAKNIRLTGGVIERIRTKLSLDYSPEQVVGDARKNQINGVLVDIIYTLIWNDTRSKGKLYIPLRTRGERYQKKDNLKARRGFIVNQKLRLGGIEMDLMVGQAHKGV